jgi:tetratricopeptide (TPR) repeat protein
MKTIETPQPTSELMQKGFALAGEQRYEDALQVGRKLKRLGHSSAFEIMALAHLGLNELPKAIATLEEGVAKAGRVWVLWELLGNCYSDAGSFKKADQAYAQALLKDRCYRDLVYLNRAIAFNRAGKFANAKSALRLVRDSRLHRLAGAQRIRTALHLGQDRVAHRLGLALLRQRPRKSENLERKHESEILLACALALKRNHKTRSKALRLAFRAVEESLDNAQALALIRELQPAGVARPRFFRLLIHGIWNAPLENRRVPPGFFRTAEVAASSPQAALGYAKPFFPKAVRRSLALEEIKVLRRPGLTGEGVYFLSAFHLYPRKKKA